jgi:hypothetical protein
VPVAHAERWQDGAIAAAILALVLARMAGKRATRGKSGSGRAAPLRAGFDAATSLQNRMAEADKTRSVNAPDKAETPKPNDVEAERARLRKAGFSDAEISQILVARQTGAANKTSFGSGVATGVLNNLDAIATHVRSLVPNLKADLTRILDRNAAGAARIGGALSLGLKVAAIVVVGYFVYLEALQFRSTAYKAWAEACIERQKNAINFSSIGELMSGKGPYSQLEQDCKQ